jgi:putative multiple sugar transport system permease protein
VTTTTPEQAKAPLPPNPKSSKRRMRVDLRQYGILAALVVIIVLFQILTEGRLLYPGNVSNLIQQNAYVLILAIGMVMVIIAGHIDLSVGSVVAVVGGVAALSMNNWGLPWWGAVVLALAVGALIGAWQGFWVAFVGIPAFIVTLAGMLIFRGLALVLLSGGTVSGLPRPYVAIGSGTLPSTGTPDLITLGIGAVASVAVIVQQLKSSGWGCRASRPCPSGSRLPWPWWPSCTCATCWPTTGAPPSSWSSWPCWCWRTRSC